MSNLKKSFELSNPLEVFHQRYYAFSMTTNFMIGLKKKCTSQAQDFSEFELKSTQNDVLFGRIAIFQMLNMKNSSEEINHLDGFPKRYYMDFVSTSSAKKIFQISHSQNLLQNLTSQPELRYEILEHHCHLKPPMSVQKCRICTFCTPLNAPRSKVCSALRITALRQIDEVMETFLDNQVQMHISISIRRAEIRGP